MQARGLGRVQILVTPLGIEPRISCFIRGIKLELELGILEHMVL